MKMGIAGQHSNQAGSLVQVHPGQQLHVSGVFIVLLEIALIVENLLPTLVVAVWLPAPAREVSDRLVAAFSVTCILSALVPTPLGLASYFSGGWYGGVPTCTTYQVTSMWCNLSSLAILTYICINSFLAVCHLMKVKSSARYPCRRTVCAPVSFQDRSDCSYTANFLPSPKLIIPQTSFTNQNSQSVSLEPPSFSSDFVTCSSSRNTAHCEINAVEAVSVYKNRVNVNTEVVVSKADCENTVSKTQLLGQEISVETSVVTESENNAQAVSQCYTGLTATTHRVASNETLLGNQSSANKNWFQQCINVNSKSSEPSPTKKILSNEITDNSSGDLSHVQLWEQSQTTNVSASRNEECSGARSEPVYSQITSEVISEKLNADMNHVNGGEFTNSSRETSTKISGCLCMRTCQSRDLVLLMLVLMFACTLAISSLPMVGFGPRTTYSETSCRSWLVPIPLLARERTFYMVYLFFVYTCLVLGCGSGVSVCLTVSRRMKQERKRKSRLYHEEENVPNVAELFALDDLKRHYSLTCVVMAGLLTWLPIVTMLTLQKLGVQVSEATLMYSNIATSLPGLLNPLLYSLALAKYRTGYKVIMEKCCCKGGAKKSHCLTAEVQTNRNTTDGIIAADTALSTSSEGHTCLHGRVNPNFDSHMDVSVDETDEENDEDYFPDDSELTEDDVKQQTTTPSEKTPLQGLLASTQSSVVSRAVFTNRSKSPWQRQQETPFSLCSDSERLLDSRAVFADEETGL